MAPQNVRAEAKSKTELLVMWEPPPLEACNGVLLGYHVGYLPAVDEVAQTVTTQSPAVPSSQPHDRYTVKTININSQYSSEDVVVDGLKAYTAYTVAVQAFNSKGPGPFSKPVTVQTDEGSACDRCHHRYNT